MVIMTSTRQFEIIYPPIIKQHLKAIGSKHYPLIQENLEAQLQYEPDVETRNRKPLKRPVSYGATWEVRFGFRNRLRAFYRVDYDNSEVIILALGEKIGNRLFIGGEEADI